MSSGVGELSTEELQRQLAEMQAAKPADPTTMSSADLRRELAAQSLARGNKTWGESAEDLARGAGAGIHIGVVGAAGIPAAATLGASWLYDRSLAAATGRPFEEVRAENEKNAPISRETLNRYTPGALLDRYQDTVGDLYTPRGLPGQFGQAVGEQLPNALFPGSAVARTAAVVVPGLVGEAAGQVADRVTDNPYVRAGARVVGGVTGGAVTSAASLPGTAERLVADRLRSIPAAERAQVIRNARDLMPQSNQIGSPLTWAEAVDHASGGITRLNDVMRVVEGSRGGGTVTGPFFADRPGQVARAGNTAIDTLATNILPPEQTALRARDAAQEAIAGQERGITAVTRPQYDAVENVRVGAPVLQALEQDPLFVRTLEEIRRNPEIGGMVAHLPNDAIPVLHLVMRRMAERANDYITPGQASEGISRTANANLTTAQAPVRQVIEGATGGPTGPWAWAQNTQDNLRRTMLEPMSVGPTGQIGRSSGAEAQGGTLLPENPTRGTEGQVRQSVRDISIRDPDAAQNLIRTQVGTLFDQATKANIPGGNQWAGAKFAAALVGNEQAERNLAAAVTMAHGTPEVWQGFRNFLDVMQAQGTRQRPGSQTAQNLRMERELQSGTLTQEATQALSTGGTSIPRQIRQRLEEFRLGANTQDLAELLVNPQAGPLLQRLAQEPAGSSRATALAARLAFIAQGAARGGGPPLRHSQMNQ
jgi:hypothetical protein